MSTDDHSDDALLGLDSRERAAEHASLRALFSPTSVAVVGAGHTRGGVGHETLRALREYGFARGTGVAFAWAGRHHVPLAAVQVSADGR